MVRRDRDGKYGVRHPDGSIWNPSGTRRLKAPMSKQDVIDYLNEAAVAQLAEQVFRKHQVAGSSPVSSSTLAETTRA